MKKLTSLLLLLCLVLTALPAAAEVRLAEENPLQFPVPLSLVNQAQSLPDGKLLIIASGEASSDGEVTRYVLCATPDGSLLWSHDLCVDDGKGFPYTMEVALLPEGIVIEGNQVDYDSPDSARLTWKIGYDGALLVDEEASKVPTDRVCHIANRGDFCIEQAYVYDEADAFYTRITNRVTGAVWEGMHPIGRCSFFALGDKLLMFDVNYESPVPAYVFDAQCRLVHQFDLAVEGEMIKPYSAIETADTLYLLVNTANGGKPWNYTVIPVDKATAAPGEPVAAYALPGADDTAGDQIFCGDGMLERFGHQPVWGEPYCTQVRHVAKDGTMTVLADVTGRPYLFATLDECYLLPGADHSSAVFFHRDENSASGYTLKTFVWDVE